jgi:hypothetical protein
MHFLLMSLYLFELLPLMLLLLPLRHELAVGLVVHDSGPRTLGCGALDDLSDQLVLLCGGCHSFLSLRKVYSLGYISISLAEERHSILQRERTHRLLLASKQPTLLNRGGQGGTQRNR